MTLFSWILAWQEQDSAKVTTKSLKAKLAKLEHTYNRIKGSCKGGRRVCLSHHVGSQLLTIGLTLFDRSERHPERACRDGAGRGCQLKRKGDCI